MVDLPEAFGPVEPARDAGGDLDTCWKCQADVVEGLCEACEEIAGHCRC